MLLYQLVIFKNINYLLLFFCNQWSAMCRFYTASHFQSHYVISEGFRFEMIRLEQIIVRRLSFVYYFTKILIFIRNSQLKYTSKLQ